MGRPKNVKKTGTKMPPKVVYQRYVTLCGGKLNGLQQVVNEFNLGVYENGRERLSVLRGALPELKAQGRRIESYGESAPLEFKVESRGREKIIQIYLAGIKYPPKESGRAGETRTAV